MHLDLSYNKFNFKDSLEISENLKVIIIKIN